ncbi:MAG: tetratricopeptide repeat protein [Candidatus Protistobacter heckmanni]|nr:tetratricopeptide repeat protein [Candidatus Protistobacter heckmanni]
MSLQLQALVQQAIHLFEGGNLAGAEALLQRVLQAQPKNFDVLQLLGIIHGRQNQHAEAKSYFSKAVKANPSNPFCHFNLAKALPESGEDAESLPHHHKTTQLAPNYPEAWLN